MKCYPLINGNSSGKLKTPTHTWNSEEYVREHNDLYLTSEPGRKFRLHATHAHSVNDYLAYDIKCPHCSNLLTHVGRPIDYNDLGLYACKFCGNH